MIASLAVILVIAVVILFARSGAIPGGAEMIIKVLYSIFLAVLVVLFVAWMMSSVIPAPDWEAENPDVPQYGNGPPPSQPTALELEGLTADERKAKFREYQQKTEAYEAQEKEYAKLRKAFEDKREKRDRNVSLISLLIAVVIVVVSVGLSAMLPVISEGLLLGGLFTLVYSIGFSFVNSPKFAVIPVGVGLIVTIALGYGRFAKPAKKQNTAG